MEIFSQFVLVSLVVGWLLSGLDDDTVDPQHESHGLSALLLAQHSLRCDGDLTAPTELVSVIQLNLPQDQG